MADIEQVKKEIASLKEKKELLSQKGNTGGEVEHHLKILSAQLEEELSKEQKYYEKQIRILELLARDDQNDISNLADKIDTLTKIIAEEQDKFEAYKLDLGQFKVLTLAAIKTIFREIQESVVLSEPSVIAVLDETTYRYHQQIKDSIKDHQKERLKAIDDRVRWEELIAESAEKLSRLLIQLASGVTKDLGFPLEYWDESLKQHFSVRSYQILSYIEQVQLRFRFSEKTKLDKATYLSTIAKMKEIVKENKETIDQFLENRRQLPKERLVRLIMLWVSDKRCQQLGVTDEDIANFEKFHIFKDLDVAQIQKEYEELLYELVYPKN